MKRLLVILFLAGLAATAPAKILSVKPMLLSPEDGPDFVAALRLASAKEWEWELGRPDRFSSVRYDFKGTLSLKPEDNDEPTKLDVFGGLEWRLDSVAPPRTTFANRNATVPLGAAGRTTTGLRWGSLSTELAFGFEGDEPMDNRNWAYGIRLNYTPAYDRADSQVWMPYLWVEYRRITELGSEFAERFQQPRQDYWRFGSQLYWQLPLSTWFPRESFAGSLTLVPGFQYHRSTSLEFARGDLNDSYQYVVGLDYTVPEAVSWSKHVPGIRLQVADGRLPTQTENRATVSIAVTVLWDSFFR